MFKNMVMYATDEAEATSEAVKTDENVDTETTEEQAKTYTDKYEGENGYFDWI